MSHDYEAIERLPSDDAFLEAIGSISRRSHDLYRIVQETLESWGFLYRRASFHIPVEELPRFRERIPQKMVATLAGLGWIGKSTLLVSPRYGARVRLSAILTDAVLQSDEPVLQSQCGECSACVDACPVGAIRNRNWSQGIDRCSLIDIHRCNDHLWKTAATLGRKQVCGLCLKACPIGQS
jgi:ferredoxin